MSNATAAKERPIIFSGPLPGWRNIEQYPDKYAISHDGRVYSYLCNREIKVTENNWGYMTVVLCSRGRARRHLIHRLVGLAFVPNPDQKPFINHLDGDKKNNLYTNLEWVTQSENERHAFANGLKRTMAGRTVSPEHRAKISASMMGKKSPCGFAGKKHSPESIAKFRESMRARRVSKGDPQ